MVFSPVATKMHAATQILSRPQARNENIHRFTNWVIQATGTDPTAVACQVTIVLFIRCLLNKEIKKQVAGAKMTQTIRLAMNGTDR